MNGWESLYTHRFAGADADDHERAKRLLELMQPYQGADREATWIEALAIADRGAGISIVGVAGRNRGYSGVNRRRHGPTGFLGLFSVAHSEAWKALQRFEHI